jgi:general secretion pathway protein F
VATYGYRAVTAKGELRRGAVEAANELEAGRKVSDLGLIVLDLTAGMAEAAAKPAARPSRRRRGRGRFGPRELQLFTRELAALMRAGLPLDSALGILGRITGEEAVRGTIEAIREAVRGGRPLSAALEAQPAFDRFYVNMVRAGEAGGVLDEVLTRLAEHIERARALRETVVSALIYPAILLGVAVISVVVLLVFVVPQFADLFADMGKALPLPTRAVIASGDFLTAYWWLLLGLLGLALWGGRRLLENPRWRRRFDARLLRLPLFGELALKAETARFARTFGTLARSGVTLVEALKISAATAGNTLVSESVQGAAQSVRQGRRVSDVLEESSPLPPLALHLIRVGEETGDLEGMLGQVTAIYDGEVQSAIKRLLAVLEPALILGLGVLIAGIIISILIAILGMNELAF